ncbi:MAG: hypothetical protein LBK67_08865 [Coriobacteriales bacterium]|jgi:hypothetical protein|nr:hypothetical protein [Coriobacteriales bacterium]
MEATGCAPLDAYRTIDFDTVTSMETLAMKARGLSGIIEFIAMAANKAGGVITISHDALEGIHGLTLDVMCDAKNIHEKVWNRHGSANDSTNRSANE